MRTYTINEIQTEMMAAGSHWWDHDTMRHFSCRVGQTVYQGEGGIYFVSSERCGDHPRAYTVRKYSPPGKYRHSQCNDCRHYWCQPATRAKSAPCPKCSGVDVAVQRAKHEDGDINTIGKFSSLTRAQAHREAARLAGPEAFAVQAAHKPVSDAEQLAIDINRNGGHATPTFAAYLIRLATGHHKAMEDDCNGLDIHDDDGEPLPPLARLKAKLTKAAEDAQLSGVIFSGDPRGCTVKLIMPNGETNDWGKEGWCIPTRN